MKFKTTVLGLTLALMGLAGCETTNDGYYDGPVEYRSRPDYRYVDRRPPPPSYRRYDRRDRYDDRSFDGPRRGYDGPSRREERRDDRRRDDDRGDRGDRRSDRGDGGRNEPRPVDVTQNRPRPEGPPRAYQPPVRNDTSPSEGRSRGEARALGRPNGPAAAACAGPAPVPAFCENL